MNYTQYTENSIQVPKDIADIIKAKDEHIDKLREYLEDTRDIVKDLKEKLKESQQEIQELESYINSNAFKKPFGDTQ